MVTIQFISACFSVIFVRSSWMFCQIDSTTIIWSKFQANSIYKYSSKLKYWYKYRNFWSWIFFHFSFLSKVSPICIFFSNSSKVISQSLYSIVNQLKVPTCICIHLNFSNILMLCKQQNGFSQNFFNFWFSQFFSH